MIVDRNRTAAADPFDLAQVKAHCQIDHDDDDASVTAMARTAALDLEDLAGLALLQQAVTVFWSAFPLASEVVLPVGPLLTGGTVTLEVDGEAYAAFEIIGTKRPTLRIRAENLSEVCGRNVALTYQAGFGTTADDVPEDLRLALADQVAATFDGRGQHDHRMTASSAHLMRVVARYRGIRL